MKELKDSPAGVYTPLLSQNGIRLHPHDTERLLASLMHLDRQYDTIMLYFHEIDIVKHQLVQEMDDYISNTPDGHPLKRLKTDICQTLSM